MPVFLLELEQLPAIAFENLSSVSVHLTDDCATCLQFLQLLAGLPPRSDAST